MANKRKDKKNKKIRTAAKRAVKRSQQEEKAKQRKAERIAQGLPPTIPKPPKKRTTWSGQDAPLPPPQLIDRIHEWLRDYRYIKAAHGMRTDNQKRPGHNMMIWKGTSNGLPQLNEIFLQWKEQNPELAKADPAAGPGPDIEKLGSSKKATSNVVKQSESKPPAGSDSSSDASSDAASDSDSDSSSDSASSSESATKTVAKHQSNGPGVTAGTKRKAAELSDDDSDSDSDSDSDTDSSNSDATSTSSSDDDDAVPGEPIDTPAKLAATSSDSSGTIGRTSPDAIALPASDSSSSASSTSSSSESDSDAEAPPAKPAAAAPPPAKRARTSGPAATLQERAKPFSRIPDDIVVDPKFSSNAYVSHDYADRAHADLSVVRGRGFTKEKNKKKRGQGFRGGVIDTTSRAVKFDD